MTGEFPPSQRLPAERKLAEHFGISRASLREALSILETLGLVRIEPHRGTFPTVDSIGISGEEHALAAAPVWRFGSRYSLADVYQFRLLNEGYAAYLATMAATDEHLAELQRIVGEHKEATGRLDFVGSSQADFELHHRIMMLTNNRMFVDLYEYYQPTVLESQRIVVARRERVWETVDEHENLIRAMVQRDPDGAQYYMRLHLTRAAGRIGIALSDTPRRPSMMREEPVTALKLGSGQISR